MNKNNPFAKLMATATKKEFIKSLDAEIEYRGLTMEEDDAFNIRLIEGSSLEDPKLNPEQAAMIKFEKIAIQLVSPN